MVAKLLLAVLIITGLAVSDTFGLSEETKDTLISLYNYTRNYYIHVDNLVDDFKDTKIDATRAEEKLEEWKQKYRKEMEAVPSEAKKMRELMLDIFDIAKELVHDYRPLNLKTKNLLDELDKVQSVLIDEMTAIKYLVQ